MTSAIHFARLLATVLVTLASVTLGARQSFAALTAAQQSAANAKLIGLWDTGGHEDMSKLDTVTVAQIKDALNQGADVNAMDTDGLTPLMLSCDRFNTYCLRFLVSKGADVNSFTKYHHQTALMQTALAGDVNSVKFLISHGADVNVRDSDGVTPLMFLCFYGSVDCAKYIAPRAAINARNKRGETALMLAAIYGKPALVQFLISKGADINLKAKDGSTALACAKRDNHPGVVAILKAAGAK